MIEAKPRARESSRPRFSFGRERRIRRRADFVRVQSKGERATSRHFVFLVCVCAIAPDVEEPARAPSRLGVVATKKIGDATVRNRVKRLCRECFRLWPGFVPDGIDLVVIAREGADDLTLDRVRDEWSRARPALLKRCANALRSPPPPASRPGSGPAETARGAPKSTPAPRS